MLKHSPLLLAASLLLAACAQPKQLTQTDAILIDQCGYAPSAEKIALLNIPGQMFDVLDAQKNVVLSGSVSSAAYWAQAGDSIRQIDFSALQTDGEYTIAVDDSLESYPFKVGKLVHADALTKAARALYYNRCSMAITPELGGTWARPAGHPDTCILVHSSAASKARPVGTVLSLPGGWYDAGDYNKYIVNSSITTYTLLLASDMFSSVADTLNLSIPESGNGIPDLTNETLYNLRWMLSMQDPNDGGVYAKLTSLSFEGFIMPADCQKQRYVVAKSTAAALDLAATAAYAARTLPQRSAQLQSLADSCKDVALKAYAWAKANPDILFHNPEDVSTGEYDDNELSDEWFWAATELWLTTADDSYAADATAHVRECFIPEWAIVCGNAYYSMVEAGKSLPGLDAKAALTAVADSLVALDKASAARLSMQDYLWGSNSFVANAAVLKAVAYKASGNAAHLMSMRDDLNYLFGRNATGYCFVTGVGTRSPLHIHHRPSAADGIDAPVPGFLAGGPNTIVPTDCGDAEPRSTFPARAYADQECSYSTNEIAINWNAPLIFALLADLAF